MPPLLLLLACAARTTATDGVEPGDLPQGRLVLAHTNDLHAHYLPERAEWREDDAALGGFVALDSWLRALDTRYGEDAVLYLDAGDVLTGTPLMELEIRGVAGGGMLELFDAVGLDGWVLGNHEFDRGYAHAAAFAAQSGVPVLSANLRRPCGAQALDCPVAIDGVEPWRIYQVNGLQVGVFGITTSGLGHLTDGETMQQLQVLDHARAAEAAVAALEPQVDLVVALTHIGLDSDRRLAEEVPGIDLVVGGHSHTRMEAAEQVGDTWIVQAGSYGRLLGVMELAVDQGRITDLSWQPEELELDRLPLPPRAEVQDLVDGYTRELDRRFSKPAGSAPVTLARGQGETPMGRFAADVVREAAGADVGIYNAGGIRSEIVAGDLTVGDLYAVFPFSNEVVWFELTGAELVSVLLSSAFAEVEDNRGALQFSGLRCEWRLRLGAPEIVSVQVDGAPLLLDRSYRVATNSFVAAQWKRNLGVHPGPVHGIGRTVLEAAVERSRRQGVTDPGDPRSVRVD